MKKVISIIATFVVSLAGVNAPVMAAGPMSIFGDNEGNNKNLAGILTDCGDPNRTDGIECVLKLAVEIIGIGVGILGVIGISVAGIQYLTAGGNEEKTRKAKRRIYEIVIGLAVYAVIYFLLKWLSPSFS